MEVAMGRAMTRMHVGVEAEEVEVTCESISKGSAVTPERVLEREVLLLLLLLLVLLLLLLLL